jgi:hypothetical protein
MNSRENSIIRNLTADEINQVSGGDLRGVGFLFDIAAKILILAVAPPMVVLVPDNGA